MFSSIIRGWLAAACATGFVLWGTEGGAAEKKPFADVNVDALVAETQKQCSPGSELNLVWVIPPEFWEVVLAQNNDLTPAGREESAAALRGHWIVAVIRADVSPFGRVDFLPEEQVFDKIRVEYSAGGKTHELPLQRRIEGDVQNVVDAMKPIMRAAMGEMGRNMNFYVCKPGATPQVSPYTAGQLQVTLDRIGANNGGKLTYEFPLDALHIPRKCPNCAKEAHVSWQFCPWCGTKHAP